MSILSWSWVSYKISKYTKPENYNKLYEIYYIEDQSYKTIHSFSPRPQIKKDRCKSIKYNGLFVSSRKYSRKIFSK